MKVVLGRVGLYLLQKEILLYKLFDPVEKGLNIDFQICLF